MKKIAAVFAMVFMAVVSVYSQACDTAPSGLVAWWQAEGNALDSIGNNNGTLMNGTSFTNGEVGQAFSFNGVDNFVLINPVSTNLDVGAGNGLTIECWIKPTTVNQQQLIAEYERALGTGNGADVGIDFVIQPSTQLYANITSTNAGHELYAPANALIAGVWQHIAVTYDKPSGLATLYINGTNVSQSNFGSFTPLTSFNNLLLGARTTFGSVSSPNTQFSGAMDEFGIYNRALSSNEIAGIYVAGSAGKCFTPAAPVILTQPQSQTNIIGGTVNFSVAASGTAPMSYQWSFNTTNIAGATNATLTLTNVQLNQAGNYFVTVSNIVGSTNSATAVLTVNVPQTCTTPPSGLVGWWRAEGNAYDSIGNNNGIPTSGVGYTNGEVGQAFNFPNSANITVADQPSLDPTNQLTIECWVYPRARTPFQWSQTLVGKDSGCDGNRQYKLIVGDDPGQSGNGDFRVAVGVPSGFESLDGATFVQSNTWYHVAETYDGTTLKLYVNGKLDAQMAVTGAIVSTPEPLRFGGDGAGCYSQYFFDGVLDEPTIYNRALSSNEIAAIYNAGSLGKCFTPVAPVITTQPTNQTLLAGGTATFGVTASGTGPLGYQWKFGGTNIVNATNTTLTLSNIQLTQAGSYSVTVSNIVGSTNSVSAVLTVNVPLVCTTPPSGLVSWWMAESNAYDSIGNNNGTLMNGTTFTPGEVGNAFSFNGVSQYVLVNASSNLTTGLNNGFTLEGWIKTTSVTKQQIIAESERVIGTGNAADVGFDLVIQPSTQLYGNVVSVGVAHEIYAPANLLVAGVWQHIAWTYDQASGLEALYINGTKVAQTNFGSFTPIMSFTNLLLGARTTFGSASSPNTAFSGGMDEMSIYGRALGSNEIAAIYNAGSAGKCFTPVAPVITTQPQGQTNNVGSTASFSVTVSGTAPIIYQWKFGGTNILNATNASLTLTNIQLPQAGNYTVTVTNVAGSTNSTNASLTVIGVAPSITTQPTNQTVLGGGTATFSVTASGTAPLKYQWQFGGTNIVNATNTTLTLTNVQLSQAGNYSVLATNAFGSTNSANAVLTVNVPVCTPAPSGLVAWWQGEGNGYDSIGTNNATVPASVTYASGEVGQAFNFNGTSTLTVADAPSLDPTNALTIEYWIYVRGKVNGIWSQSVLTKDGVTSSRQYMLNVGDSPTTPGAGDFRAHIGVPSGLKILDSLAVVQSNTWYHVAETYDGAALKLYVNGSLDSQMAVTGPIITTTQPVRIGGDAPAGPYYLNGMVDEISLYNRALSSNEIAAIYNAGSAGKCFTQVPPIITTQPTNQTVLVGGTANFGVAASGTGSLGYQWKIGGTNIVNATNATLTLNNVQLSQAGNYSVLVTNAFGSTNSVAATLTVNVPVCTPAPSGLVAWWQAEGNANDSIGNNNGTPTGGISYTNGEVGQAFVFNDTSSYIPVPASGSLNLGTNGGFTIEGWIKPDAYTVSAANGAGAPIIEWDSATQDGLDLWVYNGSLLGGIRNTNGATTVTLQSPSGVFNTNSLQHVAFTYDKSSGLGVLYLNGAVVATNNYGSVTPQTASPVNIGRRTGQTYYANATYGGLIDELSLYSRALSSNEIAAIYNAGSGGKCFTPVAPAITTQPTNQTLLVGGTATFSVAAGGTGPLGYQWKSGGTNILNATNTTLTLNNVQLSQAGSYSVMVFNIVGSTNSATAVLTVNVPVPVPAIYSFNPISGIAGTSVIIAGTNFSPIAASNIVYFGAVQATVVSASTTNLLVTVPVSATFAPITVTVNGLTAYSSQQFMPTFAGDGSGIDTSSFAPLFNLQAGSSSPGKVVIADIDGDGKPDLIVACGGGVVSIYRNISTNGTLTAGSFAPRVDLAPPSAGANPFDVEVADVDGDGKLDIVVSDFNTAQVSVYRNMCTPGNISSNLFTRVDFATGNEPQTIVVRDMDGDGKPDLLVANPGDGTVSVLRNTSVVGSLTTNSFAPKVDIATGGSCNSIAVGDLDGDGKPDMVVGCASNGNVALFRNISSPGSFTTNSFAPQVNLPGVSYTINLQIADMDGDGKPDLTAVSYLGQSLSVFRNISTVGSLTTNSFAPRIDYPLGGRGHTAAIADLDGDGKPDLAIVTELNSLFSVFRNTSTPGSFTNSSLAGRVDFPTGYNPSGVSVGDLDGDGRPDVVFGNVYDNTISIYQNTVPFAGPPVITTQPTNQTVTVGQTATFSVAAGGSQPLSYQWQFGGTNILNATNSLLTLTNVQVYQAGKYSIAVTNALGSTNSANAVLTVMLPPVITQQPQSQSVVTYGSASFTVAATGTGPLSYQWQFNGTNLVDGGNVSGSVTTNLILTGVNSSEAGNYDVVVSNPYAATNSSVAVLTVPQTVLTLASTNAMSGSTLVVPVLMNAVGAENAFQASVGYDPTKLVLQSVQPGPAAAGAYLQEVDGPPNSGQVGFVILLNTGSTQPVGTNEEVADLVFSTLPVTNNATVNLTFGDNPIARGVSDNNGNSLPTIYQNGTVTLAPAEYEADVYPRPTGDHQVGLSDWVEVGRMVAGLDTPTNSDEMLRADCAPRNAPDGVLTVADWVQAGRYELGLDTLTLVTPPPAPSNLSLKSSLSTPSPTRTLQIGTVSVGRGQTVSVPVLLVCTTNENAVGMTIGYDVSRLKFLNATLGSAIIGGRINVNTNHAPGEVGVALAMSPGLALAAGTNQVAMLQFAAMTNASGSAVLSLDGTVVKLQLADKTANVLAASYVNGAVNLPPQPVVSTAIAGTNLQLTWQVASGTFQVESASSLVGPWTIVPAPTIVTNGPNATVTVTATNNQQYFRLVGQ